MSPRAAIALTLAGFVLAISALPLAGDEASRKGDLDQLLHGVRHLASPGVPGTVCAFGDDAFVTVSGVGGQNPTVRRPVVAAARFGAGRVVVFGHDGYLSTEHFDRGDTRQFLANAIRWAGGGRKRDGMRVAVVARKGLAAALGAKELQWTEPSAKNWVASLDGVGVVVTEATAIPVDAIDAVRAWISRGGGLVTAATGWGWAQIHASQDLRDDFVGNRLLAPAGLAWSGSTIEPDADGLIDATAARSPLLHAGAALEYVVAASAHPAPAELLKDAKRDAEAREALAQASTTLADATVVAPRERGFMRELDRLQRERGTPIPTEKSPVKLTDALGRVTLMLQSRGWQRLPPEQVTAHPAAAAFPGAPPSEAPRGSRSMEVDTAVPRWHSTGLYAPAGSVITVGIPPAAATKGLHVRIGSHTDQLWQKEQWHRAPAISAHWPLKAAETRVASAFGGLVYIEVPDRCELGQIDVHITGAVDSPLFVLGKTSVAKWKQSIRELPGPWAELATDKLILTCPSTAIRDLDDPVSLLEHWDRVMDADATLAGWPLRRRSPERIVNDVQISAGYMHSGYPIMTHLDVSKAMVDLTKLKQLDSAWGFYHELGHNHQSPDWTFEGTTEVTVNLFTMYALETVCGLKPELATSRAIGPKVQPRIQKYLAAPDFKDWKEDPFLALAMYAQLRLEFGWEPYKKVFAEYLALPADQRPKSEQEKRNQWMVRLSRTVGRNLGPYFQAWGVPTSEAARQSISDLPTWMPAASH